MSWQDRVKYKMTITTGDGQVYTPQYMNAGLQLEYNLTEFTFVGVPGSRVDQKQPVGNKYSAEFYFQGADHIETSAKFRRSCNDIRPWTISHPLYDIILVKAAVLNFDNSVDSYTKVTGTLIETIADQAPNVSILPLDQVPILFQQATTDLALSLNKIPSAVDINSLISDNTSAFKKGVPIIDPLSDQFADYNNAYQTAVNYINTATATPLLMMQSVIAVLVMPAQFEVAVKQRIGVLIDTFNALRQTLFGIIAVSSKQLFQNKAGALMSAICSAAATPLPDDYRRSTDVLEVIGNIVSARNAYYQDLDSLQTPNGGSTLSFVPDAQAIQDLNTLVNTTLSALYNLSLSAKSERSIICEKDTNAILLTHRLYGLDTNDNNLNDLIDANNLSLDEYLLIEKDRKIVYYI